MNDFKKEWGDAWALKYIENKYPRYKRSPLKIMRDKEFGQIISQVFTEKTQ